MGTFKLPSELLALTEKDTGFPRLLALGFSFPLLCLDRFFKIVSSYCRSCSTAWSTHRLFSQLLNELTFSP